MDDAARSVTIREVAARAGVSLKTVSRVLNREQNVREETRARVMDAVEALDYRPNIFARSLAGNRSYLLALLYDDTPSPAYIADIQIGALEACGKEGYHLLIERLDRASANANRQMRTLIANSGVDGVILTPPVGDNPDILRTLEEERASYVRIAPDRSLEGGLGVMMDDFKAARAMTRYLLSLGHRRIGFIKGHPEHSASPLRFDGYASALEEAGVPYAAEIVEQGYFSYRSGMSCAEALLAVDPRPTAIFACNDDMAAAAMAAAQKAGFDVPGDLSVAGFDDTPLARAIWPRLTTVRQPIVEMAASAVEMLVAAAAREEVVQSLRVHDFRVKVRGSTARLAE